MSGQKNSNIQGTLSYISFLLSGYFIFSTLHKSQNIFISILFAFITGIITLFVILIVTGKKADGRVISKPVFLILGTFSYFLCTFICLMLITEIIKDTAYIADRGVSLYYYLTLATSVLFISFCLCKGKSVGIFRFSLLCAGGFLIFISIMFFSIYTTKSTVLNIGEISKSAISESVKAGVISGLFTTIDSAVYIFTLRRFYEKYDYSLNKKPFITGYLISFFFIGSYYILSSAIFGSNLMGSISDPDYALIKLIPGMDITELVSAVRIVSFVIKSAVYVYASCLCAKNMFSTKKNTVPVLTVIQYLLMPAVIFVLSIFDNTLGYGAFQHLIYPAVIAFSLCVTLLLKI